MPPVGSSLKKSILVGVGGTVRSTPAPRLPPPHLPSEPKRPSLGKGTDSIRGPLSSQTLPSPSSFPGPFNPLSQQAPLVTNFLPTPLGTNDQLIIPPLSSVPPPSRSTLGQRRIPPGDGMVVSTPSPPLRSPRLQTKAVLQRSPLPRASIPRPQPVLPPSRFVEGPPRNLEIAPTALLSPPSLPPLGEIPLDLQLGRRSPILLTTTTLLHILNVFAVQYSSDSNLPKAWEPVLAPVRRLVVTGSREDNQDFALTLMKSSRNLDEGVELLEWFLRVTEEDQRDPTVVALLFMAINDLLRHLPDFQPRPDPAPLLQHLLFHQTRLRLPDPLVYLLDGYLRMYKGDRKELNPIGADLPPEKSPSLETLRLRFLDAFRGIHQAMKEADQNVFTIRSCNSLMDGYNHGRAFEEVEKIWQLMRSEGGVGIDQRAVSVYFDACGYSGSLSRALETWKDLRTTGFTLDPNNYHSYQECLTRCGAWDDLFASLSEQQAQHLLGPTTTPPLSAPGLASALKLAKRLVQYPRHRTLHDVDRDSYDLLKRRIEDLVSKEMWEEVDGLMVSKERYFPSSGPKTGKARGGYRERSAESHRL